MQLQSWLKDAKVREEAVAGKEEEGDDDDIFGLLFVLTSSIWRAKNVNKSFLRETKKHRTACKD